jgi:hypothetical protein
LERGGLVSQTKNKEYANWKLTTGFNMQLLLGGKPLKDCTFLKLELKPDRTAKVLLEMVA